MRGGGSAASSVILTEVRIQGRGGDAAWLWILTFVRMTGGVGFETHVPSPSHASRGPLPLPLGEREGGAVRRREGEGVLGRAVSSLTCPHPPTLCVGPSLSPGGRGARLFVRMTGFV